MMRLPRHTIYQCARGGGTRAPMDRRGFAKITATVLFFVSFQQIDPQTTLSEKHPMSFIPSLDSMPSRGSAESPVGTTDAADRDQLREILPPTDPTFEMEILRNVDPTWDANPELVREPAPPQMYPPRRRTPPSPAVPDDFSGVSSRVDRLNLSPRLIYNPGLDPESMYNLPARPPRVFSPRETFAPDYVTPPLPMARSPRLSVTPDVSGNAPYQESAPPLLGNAPYRSLSSPPIDDDLFGPRSAYDDFLPKTPLAGAHPYPPQYFSPNPPAGLARPPAQAPVKKLPYPCRDFINNCCTRGNKCKFMHVKPSAAVNSEIPICRDFIRGSCFRKNCKYLHEHPRGVVEEGAEPIPRRFMPSWEDPASPPAYPMPQSPYERPASPIGMHIPRAYDTAAPSMGLYPPPRRSLSPIRMQHSPTYGVPPQPLLPSPMNRSYQDLYSMARSPYGMEGYGAMYDVGDSADVNPLTTLSPRPLNNSASESPSVPPHSLSPDSHTSPFPAPAAREDQYTQGDGEEENRHLRLM